MRRLEPPYTADERTTLVAFLDHYRETMCSFVEDLTPEQLRWTPAPGANSIAGLIKHLSYVEEFWFQERLLGGIVDLPWDDDDPNEDQDFVVPDDLSAEELVATYRRCWERSNAATEGFPLDEVGRAAVMQKTLRWVLVHMIEETARHAGHADITRQLIDGRTGF